MHFSSKNLLIKSLLIRPPCWATRLVDNKSEESRIRQIHIIQNSWVTMSLVINHHQITISINPPSSVMTVMTMIDWSKTKTQVALHASWICRCCCWSKQVLLHDPGADWIRLQSGLYTEIPGFPKNARALNLIAYNAKKSTYNAKKSTFLHWLVKSCYVNALVMTWNRKQSRHDYVKSVEDGQPDATLTGGCSTKAKSPFQATRGLKMSS